MQPALLPCERGLPRVRRPAASRRPAAVDLHVRAPLKSATCPPQIFLHRLLKKSEILVRFQLTERCDLVQIAVRYGSDCGHGRAAAGARVWQCLSARHAHRRCGLFFFGSLSRRATGVVHGGRWRTAAFSTVRRFWKDEGEHRTACTAARACCCARRRPRLRPYGAPAWITRFRCDGAGSYLLAGRQDDPRVATVT